MSLRLPHRRTLSVLATLPLLVACGPPELPGLTAEEAQKVLLVQDPAKSRITWKDSRGAPVYVTLSDCNIYRADVEEGLVVAWRVAVRKPFYLGGSMCAPERSRIVPAGSELHAILCVQGYGAGGGCSASATYASKDGIAWRRTDVPQAQGSPSPHVAPPPGK